MRPTEPEEPLARRRSRRRRRRAVRDRSRRTTSRRSPRSSSDGHGSRVSSRPDPARCSCNSVVDKAERDAILRQGVVLPETPRQRRELAALEEDLESIALRGKPLPVRARAFRPSAEAYLVATRGPLPYMLRLREIEQGTAELEDSLREGWEALAVDCADEPERFRREWTVACAGTPVRRPERPHRPAQPLVSGRVAAPHGSPSRRLRARERPRLPSRTARRGLGARALPGGAQLGAGLRALTIVSIASRSSPATSRSTVVAFSISSPGSSAAISSAA